MIKMCIYELLCFCDRLSHENESQAETIDEQAHEINALYKELEQQKTEINCITMICEVKDDVAMDIRKDLIRLEKENKELQSRLTIAENDYKKCYSENIRLAKENNELRVLVNEKKQSRRY